MKKTILERIRMAVELRRRGYCVDVENGKNKEFFRGGEQAMCQLLLKLQDIKYIDDYIQMKAKYMSDKEYKEWIVKKVK